MNTMIGDCADTTEEMTVDSRDSKDLQLDELADEHSNSNDPNEAHHHRRRENVTPEADVDMTERQTPINSPASNTAFVKSRTSPEIHMDINCNKSPASVLCIAPKTKPSISETGDSNSADSPPAQKKPRTEQTYDSHSPSPTHTAPALPTSTSPSNSNTVPKLRLNALLAADPALKPDAKDLKILHEEAQSKHLRKNSVQLPEPPALLKQEDYDVMLNTAAQSHKLNESALLSKAPTNASAAVATDMPPRIKVFMCVPCGIGFSSPSTLEAHQAFYCSHRNKDNDENNPALSTNAAEKRGSPTNNVNAGNSVTTSGGNNSNIEPISKATKTGKQYACTQCSYSADKKVSLNRHMRMHQSSPAKSSNNAANGSVISAAIAGVVGAAMGLEENASQQVDRYCSDCDIRFSNVKTYRAHKQHYCSSRRTEGQLTPKLESSANVPTPAKVGNVGAGSISPQTRTKTPTQAMVAAAAAAATLQQQTTQPFFALPTNPILIIPYALLRMGSLIPGPPANASSGILNTDSTCFMFDNGSWKPLATAALNMNALSAAASAKTTNVSTNREPAAAGRETAHSNNNEALLTEKNATRTVETAEVAPKRKESGVRESAPLDLSLRRSPIATIQQRLRAAGSLFEMDTLLEASKENLALEESGSITPEQIVCAPSLPNSPSMSPSPKRRVISPRSSGAGSTSSMSPPANVSNPASLAAVAAAGNLLDNLPLRSMLPADLALKLSESNMINPLLTKQNLELALKLSAAAAAINSSGGMNTGATPAEIAAAAVAAASTSSILAGLPVVPPAAATGSPSQPQIYVKQGVSKCKECNIVFCKYENYLAHKQHYCSARNQEPTEGENKIAGTPPTSANATTTENPTVAYQQLICAACGIKYTSLDNLRAHQNYYCPKGAALAPATTTSETSQLVLPKEKCAKCKIIHELGLPCPPPPALQQPIPAASSNVSGNVYKCPLCDAISLTASENRKHMETHGSVKAFRCSICRYKGNTLRGMRTHIRMHFDKKTTDFNEEHYMSCILEDDGIEIPSTASLNQEQFTQHLVTAQQQAVAAAVAAVTLQQQQQQQQVFNCEVCNYSSSYKGNVLRHMKLVHPQLISNSPSLSPEATLPSIETKTSLDANSSISNINGENNGAHSFSIKSEPLDTQPTLTAMAENNTHENNNSPPITLATSNTTSFSHIKAEPLDIAADQHTTTTNSMAHLPPPPPTHVSPAPQQQSDELNQKYCQTCDISFNYMKTYLAHKQFYCKNKILRPEMLEERSSPNTAVVSILPPVSPDPLLLQKNKESLQQEAAI